VPISTPTLNPHPFPSNWGRKRIYVLHGLWVILCYYSLDGSPLHGVASLLHCGRTPLVGVPLSEPPWLKTPKMNPHGQNPTPEFTPEVKTPQIYPLDQKSPKMSYVTGGLSMVVARLRYRCGVLLECQSSVQDDAKHFHLLI